jgi:hypothetical protein
MRIRAAVDGILAGSSTPLRAIYFVFKSIGKNRLLDATG